ncbi:ankyrin repeat-containing domain protein [Aspergillus lucknowensis]|uniref:Ankyrin repeat-containing domain protein n=1 Tax=Aspergillus lucknowensis TaxID=176173 RepID=A0ABR4LT41_9EURO
MELADLPHDLLNAIWEQLESFQARDAFVRTCRLFESLFNPKLYRHAVLFDQQRALRWAAEHGPLSTLQKLQEAGADLAGQRTFSPLAHAAARKRVEMVKYLLAQGVNPTEEPASPAALQEAVEAGDMEIIRILVDAMKQLLTPPMLGSQLANAALESAVDSGREDILKFLFEHGVDVNFGTGYPSQTPLERAITWDKHWLVEFLLDEGASAENLALPSGLSPLRHAVEYGSASMVDVLFKRSLAGQCTEELAVAVMYGKEETVRILLNNGADPGALGRNGEIPICCAADRGLGNIVAMLLQAGVTQEEKDMALIDAAANSHQSVVAMLFENSAELVAADGTSALTAAARGDHAEMVRYLLRAGIASELTTPIDDVLWHCSRLGYAKTVEVLLEYGADPSWGCNTGIGFTALSVAAQNGHTGVMRALLSGDDHPRYIDLPDVYRRTPLFHATVQGHGDIVRMLMAQGSKAANTPTASGDSALSFADKYRHRKFDDRRDGVLQGIWECLSSTDGAQAGPDDAVDTSVSELENKRPEGHCSICVAMLSPFEDFFDCDYCIIPPFDRPTVCVCGHCIARGGTCFDPSHTLIRNPPYWDEILDPGLRSAFSRP